MALKALAILFPWSSACAWRSNNWAMMDFFSFLLFLSPRLGFGLTLPKIKCVLFFLVDICFAFNAFWSWYFFQFHPSTFYFMWFLYLIWSLFFIIFLSFFLVLSLNIVFHLIFFIQFGPHSFDCYFFLPFSWFILFFNLVPHYFIHLVFIPNLVLTVLFFNFG